jgi:hypothetical protein
MANKIAHLGFPNCYELANGDARVIVSSDFGPRILWYSLKASENILGWHPGAAVSTELGIWKPYGGHRLWQAPENMPYSYAPDDGPVEVEIRDDLSLTLAANKDAAGIEKRMTLTLSESGSLFTIEHGLTNHGQGREISAWGLTIMAPGGEAIIPNETFAPYSGETLLPVRTVAIWSYTELTDPRWTFTKNEIKLRVDEAIGNPQKIGVLNKQGWAGYRLGDLFFKKSFKYVEGAIYPDMNSNTEIYTAGSFVEVESLSPLRRLETGESLDYMETWELTSDASLGS